MRTLIADLDGTIVKCGRIYNAANQEIAHLVADRYGVTEAEVLELIGAVDLWAIKASHAGFSRSRYPLAVVAATGVVSCLTQNGSFEPDFMLAMCKIADAVFEAHYEPFIGAVATITAYAEAGWRVLIYTKGEDAVQRRKVTEAGLDGVVHGVTVVDKKDLVGLEQFCAEHGVDPRDSVYVGDSLRDDIQPAYAAGFTTVWVHPHAEDTWHGYDLPDADGAATVQVDLLAEMPNFIDIGDG